jgi:hypothetical protein
MRPCVGVAGDSAEEVDMLSYIRDCHTLKNVSKQSVSRNRWVQPLHTRGVELAGESKTHVVLIWTAVIILHILPEVTELGDISVASHLEHASASRAIKQIHLS